MNSAARLQVASGSRVIFGSPSASVDLDGGVTCLRLAVPVLAGREELSLAGDNAEVTERNGCFMVDSEDGTTGFTVAAPGANLDVATTDAYRRLFAATEGLHLYRIWNYVPGINAVTRGLENYRRFSQQRSLAFEERFGSGFRLSLPAASAVGSTAGPIALEWIAGRTPPRHFENPRQLPAFEYPREYGPRPPSFSRATVAVNGPRRRTYISGTAAVVGHATVALNDIDGQLECTLENLRVIGERTGVGADLGRSVRSRRAFRIYFRNAGDLPRVRPILEQKLLRSDDLVSWLQADICRRDLLVEIEAGIETTD